jgi:hypothetical protein
MLATHFVMPLHLQITLQTESRDSRACVCCGVRRMAIYFRENSTGSTLLLLADRGISIGYCWQHKTFVTVGVSTTLQTTFFQVTRTVAHDAPKTTHNYWAIFCFMSENNCLHNSVLPSFGNETPIC